MTVMLWSNMVVDDRCNGFRQPPQWHDIGTCYRFYLINQICYQINQ